MDIESLWDDARRRTEIIRMRLSDLPTFEAAAVPYVFLAESSLNRGDTVVRRGQVMIERPALLLPGVTPHFEGFEFERDWQLSEQSVSTFLLIRGIQFPSLRYRHEVSSLDVLEDSLQQAIKQYTDRLAAAEDVATGLVVGPEAAWQFSILLLVAALVVRSARGDLQRILETWRKRPQQP